MDPNTIAMYDGVDGEPADWVCTMIISYINCSNVTEVQHDTEGADERRRGVVVVRPELVSNHLKTGSVRCQNRPTNAERRIVSWTTPPRRGRLCS